MDVKEFFFLILRSIQIGSGPHSSSYSTGNGVPLPLPEVKGHFSNFKLTEVTEANNYLTQMTDTGKDLNKNERAQTLNLENS